MQWFEGEQANWANPRWDWRLRCSKIFVISRAFLLTVHYLLILLLFNFSPCKQNIAGICLEMRCMETFHFHSPSSSNWRSCKLISATNFLLNLVSNSWCKAGTWKTTNWQDPSPQHYPKFQTWKPCNFFQTLTTSRSFLCLYQFSMMLLWSVSQRFGSESTHWRNSSTHLLERSAAVSVIFHSHFIW